MGTCGSKAALPPDASLQPPFAHSGWLSKAYPRPACVPAKPVWRKRWVVLSGSQLFIFKGMDDEGPPAEWMDLNGASLTVMLTHPAGSNYFELTAGGSDGAVWALRAPSELSLADWVTRFNKQCTKGLVKDMVIDAGLLPKATSLVALASPAPAGLGTGLSDDAFTPDGLRSPSVRIARQLSLSTGGGSARASVRGLTPSLRAINYAEALEALSRPLEAGAESRTTPAASGASEVLVDSDLDSGEEGSGGAAARRERANSVAAARARSRTATAIAAAVAAVAEEEEQGGADEMQGTGHARDHHEHHHHHHHHRVADHELDHASLSPLARQPVKSLFLAASPVATAASTGTKEEAAGQDSGSVSSASSSRCSSPSPLDASASAPSASTATAALAMPALPPPPPPPPLGLGGKGRRGTATRRDSGSAAASDGGSSSFTAQSPLEAASTPAGRPTGRGKTRMDSALDIGSYDLDIHLESLRPLNLSGSKSPALKALASPPRVPAPTPVARGEGVPTTLPPLEELVLEAPAATAQVGDATGAPSTLLVQDEAASVAEEDDAASQPAQCGADAGDDTDGSAGEEEGAASPSHSADAALNDSATSSDSAAPAVVRETLYVEVPLAGPAWLQASASPKGGSAPIPRFSMGSDGHGTSDEEEEGQEAGGWEGGHEEEGEEVVNAPLAEEEEVASDGKTHAALQPAEDEPAVTPAYTALAHLSPIAALRASVAGLVDFTPLAASATLVASPRSPVLASPRAADAGVTALSPGRLTGDLVPTLEAEVTQRSEAVETSLSRLGGVLAGATDGYDELLARPDKRRWWKAGEEDATSGSSSNSSSSSVSPRQTSPTRHVAPSPTAPSPPPALASPVRDAIKEAVGELLAEAVSPRGQLVQAPSEAVSAEAGADQPAPLPPSAAPPHPPPVFTPVSLRRVDDWGYPLTASPRPHTAAARAAVGASPRAVSLSPPPPVEHIRVSLPAVLSSAGSSPAGSPQRRAASPARAAALGPPPSLGVTTYPAVEEEDGDWFVKSPSPRPLRAPHTVKVTAPRVQAVVEEVLVSPGWGSPLPTGPRLAAVAAATPAETLMSPLTSQLSPLRSVVPGSPGLSMRLGVTVGPSSSELLAQSAALPAAVVIGDEAASMLPPPPPPPARRPQSSAAAGSRRSYPSAVAATSPIKPKAEAVVARPPAEPFLPAPTLPSAAVAASRVTGMRGASRWLTRAPQQQGGPLPGGTASRAPSSSSATSRSSWLGAPAAARAGSGGGYIAPRPAAAMAAAVAAGGGGDGRALVSSTRWLAPRDGRTGFR